MSSNDNQAVFQGKVQGVQSSDALRQHHSRDDDLFQVPVQHVPVPSEGKVYPPEHPLHLQDGTDITAMTAREEDILTSRALATKGTMITEFVRSCLCDKTIDPTTLLDGDRNALMIAIRITGYGNEYDAKVECSGCSKISERTFNLSNLEIKRLTIDPVETGKNAFSFTLPVSKKNVVFKFLTGRDAEEADKAQTQKQKVLGTAARDTNVTSGLLQSIISIDNVSDRAKLNRAIGMMPAGDSFALRKFIGENTPGISMKQSTTCEFCNHEEEVGIPLGVSFFWPHLA